MAARSINLSAMPEWCSALQPIIEGRGHAAGEFWPVHVKIGAVHHTPVTYGNDLPHDGEKVDLEIAETH